MIKIKIVGLEVILKYIQENKIKEIELISGQYDGKFYDYIIISENHVFLEGDETLLLLKSCYFLEIIVKNNLERIADKLERKEILIDGIGAIKNEEKDLVLNLLLNT